MAIDGPLLGAMVLRTFLGELFDSTFLLTAIFAAWCPWEGLRNFDDRFLQLSLVFSGAMLAHTIRVVLLHTILPKPALWTPIVEGICCALTLVLCIKARMDMRHADVSDLKKRIAHQTPPAALGVPDSNKNPFTSPGDDQVGAPTQDPTAEWNRESYSGGGDNQWNRDAFGGTAGLSRPSWAQGFEKAPKEFGPPASTPPAWASGLPQLPDASKQDNYGTITSSLPVDGVFAERISDKLLCLLLSFMLTCILIFVGEAEDKSQQTIRAAMANSPGAYKAESIIGSVAGYVPAVLLAVLLGYLLERQASDGHLLFAIMCCLFGISVVSLERGIQHISFLEAKEVSKLNVVTTSLLSFGASARSDFLAP